MDTRPGRVVFDDSVRSRARPTYPRRRYRQALRRFLWGNRLVLLASLAIVGGAATFGAAVVDGYMLGLVHGVLGATFASMVFVLFLAHTGSIWQLAGSWGEQNTTAELRAAARRGEIHAWVDNIELAGTDIDHLVITSGGVLSLDSKWHGRHLDSQLAHADAERARYSARRAQSVLRSVQMPMSVRPVVVVWGTAGGQLPPEGRRFDDVDFVAGRRLRSWLGQQRGRVIDPDQAAKIRRSLLDFRSRVRPPR